MAEDVLYAFTAGHRSSLERMRKLDASFGSPSKAFSVIHVAGTNGKGSVCAKVAFFLEQLGYKTGRYLSPHIYTFQERISINGIQISKKTFFFFLKKILKRTQQINFFEVFTLIAFLYFQQEQVDFAVIETGIGGALDATNIVFPDLSLITSISYDHKTILGDSLEKIAKNKAGIIKLGVPVVLGFTAAVLPVFQKIFQEKSFFYVLPPFSDWEEENEAIAKKAIHILFPKASLLEASIKLPCRFEVVSMKGHPVVFDIAHNPDSLEKLFFKLRKTFLYRPFFVIFGVARDKDVSCMTRLVKKEAASIYPFAIKGQTRLLSKKELFDFFSVSSKAFKDFLFQATAVQGVLVVTGSSYIMKEAKKQLVRFFSSRFL